MDPYCVPDVWIENYSSITWFPCDSMAFLLK